MYCCLCLAICWSCQPFLRTSKLSIKKKTTTTREKKRVKLNKKYINERKEKENETYRPVDSQSALDCNSISLLFAESKLRESKVSTRWFVLWNQKVSKSFFRRFHFRFFNSLSERSNWPQRNYVVRIVVRLPLIDWFRQIHSFRSSERET